MLTVKNYRQNISFEDSVGLELLNLRVFVARKADTPHYSTRQRCWKPLEEERSESSSVRGKN